MENEQLVDNDLAALLKEGESISTVDKLNHFAWESRRSDLNKSYNAAHFSEEIAVRLEYEKGIGQALKTQGYCLWRYSDYHNSMEKSSAALEIAQKLKDPKEEADILNSIGAVYMFLNDNENRLKCNLECLELRTQIKHHEGIAGSLNNIGETYMEMGDFEKAQDYLNQCLNYPESTKLVVGWVYHNLGVIESRRKNYVAAAAEFSESIQVSTAAGDQSLTLETLYFKALNEGDLGNNEKMMEVLFKAMELANTINAKDELQKIHLAISKLYESQDDIVKAFKHFSQHSEIHNQVYNERNASLIHNLKSKYELNAVRKEAEIERLKNVELKKAFEEIEQQKNVIEIKNNSIRDSIQYARKIQTAVLSFDDQWDAISKQRFVLFYPKDVVSGDFYWAYYAPEINTAIWVVADCTGHGVPGAFMSMLGVGLLNEIVVEGKVHQPDEILNRLRDKIKKALEEKGAQSQRQDGMDISLCVWNKDTNLLKYSGAYNPLYIVSKRDLNTSASFTNEDESLYLNIVKADKQPVGAYVNLEKPFTTNEIQLEKGDRIYSFSDGYVDQFGGKEGKKFMKKSWIQLLLQVQPKSIVDQRKELEEVLNKWMKEGNSAQLDDICVVGIEIN